MSLAVIQRVEMGIERLWVPTVRCDVCRQRMPADHEARRRAMSLSSHINSEAGPGATEPAPDPTKEINAK